MNMDCSTCPIHCCGRNDVGAPILTPKETAQYSSEQMVDCGHIYRLARGADGNCIFYDNGRCTQYDTRPIECQLYPWIIQYSGDQLTLVLHDKCPQHMTAPMPQIPPALFRVPKYWKKAFSKLPV